MGLYLHTHTHGLLMLTDTIVIRILIISHNRITKVSGLGFGGMGDWLEGEGGG